MDDMERCLLVKQEVFVYKIPPRQSARGYRAADWNLSSPDWTGRLRIMEASKKVVVSFCSTVLVLDMIQLQLIVELELVITM